MPKCLYLWETQPELVRFVAVIVLTYVVDVARRYMAGEFDGLTDWRPVALGLVIGGVQFVGARLLAAIPPTPPPPTRITPSGPARDEGGFRET